MAMKCVRSVFAVFVLLCGLNLQAAMGNTEKTGDVLALLIPSIAFGGTFFNEEGHEGSMEFLKALGSTQLITKALKTTIRKRRPNGKCCDSFPSGHSSRAFSGASFIQKRYGFKYSIPAYLASAYVGYSRVDANQHEIEDVVVGALVGILGSYVFVHPYTQVQVTAVAENGMYGLSFKKRL